MKKVKLTPGQAIRKYCIDCAGGAAEVKDCRGDTLIDGPCLFYRYRIGRGRPSVRLIRRNCLYCMGGHVASVRDCPSIGCVLKLYRTGKTGRKRPTAGFKSPQSTPGTRLELQETIVSV